jgi:hypothetical protein
MNTRPEVAAPDYKGFALAIMEEWPDVGTLDGFELQELGEKYGLLRKEERVVPCDPEYCQCSEFYEIGAKAECFRKNWIVYSSNQINQE